MGHGVGKPVQFGVLLLQFADKVFPLFFCMFSFRDIPGCSKDPFDIPGPVAIDRCIIKNRDDMTIAMTDFERVINNFSSREDAKVSLRVLSLVP